MPPLEVVLKRFETPDEIRTFDKGKFELIHLGGLTIGRATYEPGWKWSVHVGPALGAARCNVEHVGMVLSGCATAAQFTNSVRASCSTFPPVLPDTIAGLSATSRTSPCTFWARITTRQSRLDHTKRMVSPWLSPTVAFRTIFVDKLYVCAES